MANHPNSADAITLSGGLAKTIGAFNLDKEWGGAAIGLGVCLDGLDGHDARINGTADELGALLDKSTDRTTEGIIVASLVSQEIVPAWLPIVGYGVKLALRQSGKDGSVIGNAAAICKDAAIGVAIASTMFDRESRRHSVLKAAANILGWTAVGLGLHELSGSSLVR